MKKKYNICFTGKELILLQHPVTTQSESTKNEILSTLRAIVKLNRTTIAIFPNSDAGNTSIFDEIDKYSKKFQFIHSYPSLPRSDFFLRNAFWWI